MTRDHFKKTARSLIKKWWGSFFLLPFIIYSIHQCYWTLNYNIFFSISYEFPFPVNFIHFLLDNFLLIVHEAGHTFFGIAGFRTLTILGGSLFQILLSLLILAYTLVNRLKIGMQLSLYLTGFSFMGVAFYAADAGARQLPLIGGLSKESHDWYNLLSRWNLLDQDLTVAVILSAAGIICYLISLTVPLFFKKYGKTNIDLSV